MNKKIVEDVETTEGDILCDICGSIKVKEEGKLICPHCDVQINFFGEDDADDTDDTF